MTIARSLSLLMMAMLTIPSLAQVGSETISFQHLEIPGTIRSSQVHDMIQDQQGVIWLVHNGLVRFDGSTFTTYQHLADSGSISGWEVNCLLFDVQKKRILVGTRNYGIVYYDYGTNALQRIPSKDGTPIINALVQTSDGTVWASSFNSGMFRVEKDTLRRFHEQQAAIRPSSMMATGNSVYVGDYKRIYVYKNGVLRDSIVLTLPGEAFEVNARATAMSFANTGHLYIGTEKEGMIIYDTLRKSVVRHFVPEGSPFFSRINRIFEDSHGKIWVLTKANGVVLYDPKKNSLVTFTKNPFSENSISGDFCSSIIEDNSGILWIGSSGSLNKYDPDQVKFLHVTNDPTGKIALSDKMVRGMYEDEQHRLWFGTDGGYINIWDRAANRMNKIKVVVPGLDRLIQPMWFFNLDDNFVLIGTPNGLLKMNKKTQRFSLFEPLIQHTQNRMVRQIVRRGDDLYMIVSAKLLRYNINTKKIKTYGEFGNKQNRVTNVTALYLDSKQRLWLGVGGGISLFDTESETFDYVPIEENSIRPDGSYFMVLSLQEQDSILWVGTFNTGLWTLKYDNKKTYTVQKFSTDDVIANGTVYGCLIDYEGNLWLGTNQGLAKYIASNNTIHHFSPSEGIQDDEFNRLSFLKTSAGEMCFGGINGFNLFDPRTINLDIRSVAPELISLTSTDDVTSQYISLLNQQEVTIPYYQNTVTFQYFIPDFGEPRRYTVNYKLESYDSKWKTVTDNSITYAKLPPGNYTFSIKTVNLSGSERLEQVKLIVLQPFWATWWFIVIVLASLVFLIGAGIEIYLHKARIDNLRLEELLKERTFEIEKSHEELQLLNQKKDLIFSILSHDLRSPLTTLKGFLGILIDNGESLTKQEIQKHAISIRNSVTNSLDLIDNTLFWSLSQMGNITYTPSTILLNPLLEKIRGLYQLTADRKKIKLSMQYEDNLIIEADENMLYVILRNLVSNALKFTSDGREVKLLAFAQGDMICVQVIDQGIGMSSDQINRLLTMNQPMVKKGTLNEKGTGLGLLLCKQFVDMNKGMLTIYSVEHSGTTVAVTFPKAKITS